MKISVNLLQRLADRFGIAPLSKVHPKIQKALANPQGFIKAPAGVEPFITGGGYQWDDDLNGYRLGQNQKIFVAPSGAVVWIFKDVLIRLLNLDRVQKWVSHDDEYPMGKANAFFTIYGKLTGQDLGQGDTAGDEVPDGEQDADDGGGVASADDGPPFSKEDIQNMLKGEFGAAQGSGVSMDTAIPGEEPSGIEDEPSVPVKGPPPDRSKVGNPLPPPTAKDIIQRLYKMAKVNPSSKLSKQNPIRLDGDKIIDLYQQAKTMPDGEELIAFLKSGAVLPLEEGKILKSHFQSLVEGIVTGIVDEVEKAKKKSKEKKSPEDAKMDKTFAKSDKNYKPGKIAADTAKLKSSPPEHSQMDWDASGEKTQNSWDKPSHEGPDYGKWIIAVANKLWKDKMDIGQGRPSWQLQKVVKHPTGEYYFLGKEKTVHLNRAFKRADNKWYYLEPDAKKRILGNTWIELGKEHPSDEPSIEQDETQLKEMTTTSGGGGSSAGTTGYNIPGAWAPGKLEKNKKHIEVLGYKLTPAGKKEMSRSPDKLYESKKNLKEASGLGPDFDRAQRAYDNQMPPEDPPEVECPECGGAGHYNERWRKGRFYMWSAACDQCGNTWGDDNLDDDRGER